tara:strand:+ start:2547 stop:7154 length:4608 start_codon:yes stop_codon:yes gene_type:complete
MIDLLNDTKDEALSADEFNEAENSNLQAEIANEEAKIKESIRIDQMANLTDYEQKELKQGNQTLVDDMIINIRNEIGMDGVQEQPSEILANIDQEQEQKKEAPQGPAALLPPTTPFGIQAPYAASRALSGLSTSTNPIIKGIGQTFKAQADVIGGTVEGFENFVKAFPKKYEALKNDFNDVEIQSSLNELKRYNSSVSKYSSGDFSTQEGLDIPRTVGNMVGFAAPVVGTGILAGKGAAAVGLGKAGIMATTAASEFALGAVLTTKQDGSLFNFLENMGMVDRELASKIPFYVTKDDSELMASLKGGSENLLLFMTPMLGVGAAKAGQATVKASVETAKTVQKNVVETAKTVQKNVVNLMQKTGDLVKESLVTKHIKANPSLIEDYARVAKKGAYNKSEFLDFVMKDFVTKEIDNKTFLGYVFDEEGSIFIGNKNNKGLKAADDAVSEVGEGIDEATSKTVNEYKDAVKSNDLERVEKSYKELNKNKAISKDTKNNLKKPIEFLSDFTKTIKRIKKSEPNLVKAIQDISDKSATSATITTKEVKDGSFLVKMSKKDSDIHDLFLQIKKSGVAKDEIKKLTKLFPDTKAQKISDVQVTKAVQDFSDTYGYKIADQNLSKKDIRDLVEVTAIAEYAQTKAIEDAVEAGRKLNNYALDPSNVSNQREYQMLLLRAYKTKAALENITTQFNQIRHDVGAAFRLLKPKIREKVSSQIKTFSEKDLLSDETQMFLTEQMLALDDAKLRTFFKKLEDVQKMVDDGLTPKEAYKKLLKQNNVDDFVTNFGQYSYNNFLSHAATNISNIFGLSYTVSTDAIQDVAIKNLMANKYYGTYVINNKTDAMEVLSALKDLEAKESVRMGLMGESKFLTNYRNKDGSFKTKKEIFSESFITGRSLIDRGSEKYGGVGYSRFTTKKDRIAAQQATGTATKTDDVFQQMLTDTLAEEVEVLSKKKDFFASQSENKAVNVANRLADLHSMPLRLLQATDELAKSEIIGKKYHRIVGEAVSKKIAAMDEKQLVALRKDYGAQVKKLYQKEMNNVDHFNQAKFEANEITFQNKYNDGFTPNFTFRVPFVGDLPISKALKWDKFPIIRVLHPFARMSANMADYMSQYTPGIGALNAKIYDDLKAGGYRRAKALSKQSTGLLMASACYYLASKNVVTGNYSSKRKFKEDQRRLGYKPYSFNIGDEASFPLQRVDPIGTYCGLVADVRQKIVEDYNNGNESGVDQGLAWLESSVKLIPEVFSPTVVRDFLQQANLLLSKYDSKAGASVAGVANIVNNLSSRSFPRFLFLQPEALNLKGEEKKQIVEYSQEGIDLLKSFQNALYETPAGYLFNKDEDVEPELDDFGKPVNRYGMPKDLIENFSDQEYVDMLYSPVFSSSLLKQKKFNPDPVYKELRRLNKNFVENFKSKVYTNKEIRHLDNRAEHLDSIQLLAKIPRSFKIENSAGALVPYKLTNSEYNNLKRYINRDNRYYEEIKGEIEYYKRKNVSDADLGIAIYSASRKFVSDRIKRWKSDNFDILAINADKRNTDERVKLGLEQ